MPTSNRQSIDLTTARVTRLVQMDAVPIYVVKALLAQRDELLASLKEMGDWIAAGLQASDEAWPDAQCLQHTEEIAARARAAVDKAEGRS